MPIHHIITHRCELTAPLTVTPLRHALSSGDERGDRFEVTVTRGGQPVALDGASVQAYFLRASDGGTVALTGSAEGNVAVLELPEACYAVPGRFTLTVKVSVGDTRHAVYVAEGAVLRASTEEIIDPGHSVPDLGELLARIAQLEAVTAEGQQAAAAAGTAATSATAAAKSAHDAAASANTAKENADKATSSANTAASGATNAAQSANTARTNADKATAAANTAATSATAAAKSASDKAAELQRQADSGDFHGATFTPEVSASGVLSWTNDRGLDNPPPVSIKGEKGDKGEPGTVIAWNGIEPDDTGNVTAAIGGRNLALGSRGEFITASNAETNKLGVALPLSDDGREAVAPVGAGILISYEARADVPGQKMYYSLRRADSEPSSIPLQIVSLTTGYRRYCFRGKTTLEGSRQVIPLIYKASDGAGGVTGKVYIRNVKVELGDVPTDWSPAPEDPAPSAEKLSAAHQITLSGDVTGSASFDGSGDASISATLRDIGVGISAGLRYGPDTTTVSAGYGGKLTVPRFLLDSKGRVVSADNATVTLPAYPTGVESAGRLATPRKINGVAFDGSKDITVSDEALAARVQTLEERLAALESRKE